MTGEAFDPVEVDMGRSEENNITQSGGTEWSKRDKSTYDPTDDIEAYALNASGVVNIIVFDPKGWALFRSFKAVKEKLDTRRGSNTHSISGTANSAGAHQHKSSGAFGGTNTSIFPNGYTAISNPSAGIMSTTSGSGQTRNAGKTSSDGAHTHSLSGTAASAGAHAHTVGIGAHTHSVAIGSHGHTITVNAAGNAENTVKNIAFNYIVRLA